MIKETKSTVSMLEQASTPFLLLVEDCNLPCSLFSMGEGLFQANFGQFSIQADQGGADYAGLTVVNTWHLWAFSIKYTMQTFAGKCWPVPKW